MKLLPSIHWSLGQCMLCMNCEAVFQTGPSSCPACTSNVITSLARFLSWKPEREATNA